LVRNEFDLTVLIRQTHNDEQFGKDYPGFGFAGSGGSGWRPHWLDEKP
jgi:hypothetical protein